MLDEHEGDVVPDLDGSGWLQGADGSQLPLPGAVVDQVGDPLGVLGEDGVPEELLVSSTSAGPLLGEPLCYTRELDGVLPDLVHRQLRPERYLDGVGDLVLELHDPDTLKDLLDEPERTVILPGEEHSLPILLVRTSKNTYRLVHQVDVEGLLAPEALVDLLDHLSGLGVGGVEPVSLHFTFDYNRKRGPFKRPFSSSRYADLTWWHTITNPRFTPIWFVTPQSNQLGILHP